MSEKLSGAELIEKAKAVIEKECGRDARNLTEVLTVLVAFGFTADQIEQMVLVVVEQ